MHSKDSERGQTLRKITRSEGLQKEGGEERYMNVKLARQQPPHPKSYKTVAMFTYPVSSMTGGSRSPDPPKLFKEKNSKKLKKDKEAKI
ncbi:hypothetical protein BaRGS_00037344 [Batillaria attramentaria]|uniref:Uncharacterized protein n=1 Tax=Batillaria attramentaria TaxID=370345 RepID=A0ABD0J954_9CAEN